MTLINAASLRLAKNKPPADTGAIGTNLVKISLSSPCLYPPRPAIRTFVIGNFIAHLLNGIRRSGQTKE